MAVSSMKMLWQKTYRSISLGNFEVHLAPEEGGGGGERRLSLTLELVDVQGIIRGRGGKGGISTTTTDD